MILKLGNITINFNDNPFLSGINCEFQSGKLNLIVGRSGSGKSTLLKLIAGFHKNFTGAISLDENYFEPEGNIALAFQSPESLFFNPTVSEEISYSLKMAGEKLENINWLTKNWMEKWGLDFEKYKDKYPFRLSGGEKRRVALSACTIIKPKIILLDEPLAGLDRAGQGSLSKIINELSQNHIVIVVTHEPELLLKENSNVLYLDDSRTTQLTAYEFIYNALINPNFYPLPNWYLKAVSPYVESYDLPMVEPETVANFLKAKKDESA